MDGVPRGQPVLDALVQLLDVQGRGDDLFTAVSPAVSPVRVFGGQVAAQALMAAGRTVAPGRRLHSLHAYFVRPGDARVPIDFAVENIRDGSSFSIRRVQAQQHQQAIFVMSSSFQSDEMGVDGSVPMPAVPSPDELPTFADRVAMAETPPAIWSVMPRAFDLRHVRAPSWSAPSTGPEPGARSQVWFRADGILPDDELLHVCLLVYLSDLTLLDAALVTHGLAFGFDRLQLASLDHAMWFHRPIRLDDWVLYDMESPSASGGRALATGRFFGRDGSLLATVVQEGLVRLHSFGGQALER